jgi:hypothetical protein
VTDDRVAAAAYEAAIRLSGGRKHRASAHMQFSTEKR